MTEPPNPCPAPDDQACGGIPRCPGAWLRARGLDKPDATCDEQAAMFDRLASLKIPTPGEHP